MSAPRARLSSRTRDRRFEGKGHFSRRENMAQSIRGASVLAPGRGTDGGFTIRNAVSILLRGPDRAGIFAAPRFSVPERLAPEGGDHGERNRQQDARHGHGSRRSRA